MKLNQFLVTVLMPISIGLEYAVPRGMFMWCSRSIHAVLTSFRLSLLYSPSNLMVTWNPSVRPVSREIISYMGILGEM